MVAITVTKKVNGAERKDQITINVPSYPLFKNILKNLNGNNEQKQYL